MSNKSKGSTTKITAEPTVTFSIVPGTVTLAQKQAWRRFWQKLIAEAKPDAH